MKRSILTKIFDTSMYSGISVINYPMAEYYEGGLIKT